MLIEIFFSCIFNIYLRVSYSGSTRPSQGCGRGSIPLTRSKRKDMRKQQQIWQNEHANPEALPSLTKTKPADAAIYFVNYLRDHQQPLNGKAIDIGCGKGRNSVFLAKQGFDVCALDYIKEALDKAKVLAEENNILEKIKFYQSAFDEQWPFEDNFFDVALDSFSSIDIETENGRNIYKREMFRTLKPGGFAFVGVVSAEDEQEKEMILKSPGPEKNSAIWPNGKFQKDYDEEELKSFYKEFKILELKSISKPATKLGRNYTGTDIYLILQKP